MMRLFRPPGRYQKDKEMTISNEAYKRAAKSPAAKQATETAKSIGEDVRDFASDVSRKAGNQFSRAQDTAVDALQEAGDTMKRYPLSTLAIVAGLGFMFGVIASSRR
jgi:ElaB/YqjD/DUF883 family membrane-anchored ribosome-binding protein